MPEIHGGWRFSRLFRADGGKRKDVEEGTIRQRLVAAKPSKLDNESHKAALILRSFSSKTATIKSFVASESCL